MLIATTKQRIRLLAWQLDQLSSLKTATYLRTWLQSVDGNGEFSYGRQPGGGEPDPDTVIEMMHNEIN